MDVRTAQRYLKKGLIDRQEFEKHLAALPDLSEESTFVDYETQFAEEQRKDAETQAEPAPIVAEAPRAAPPPAVHPAHGYPPATAAPLPASPLSATPPSVAHQAETPALSPVPGSDDGGEQGS